MTDFHASYGTPLAGRLEGELLRLARELIDENPALKGRQLGVLLRDRVEDSPDRLLALCTVFMTGQLHNYESRKRRHDPEVARLREEVTSMEIGKVKERTKRIVEGITRNATLDVVCPNGKRVRENTGAYNIKFGGVIGAIGRAVGPNEIVGKVLTDERANAIESAFNQS
jgi:hypothetical protein